jgi:hypothetical protein
LWHTHSTSSTFMTAKITFLIIVFKVLLLIYNET